MNNLTSSDREAVTEAYRKVREGGGQHHPAFNAAFRVYRERHPLASGGEAARAVSRLIIDAGHNGLLNGASPGQ